MEELKPCPFCGPKGRVKRSTGPQGYHNAATCICCGCVLTVEAWNARPIEDTLREELSRAKEDLQDRIALEEFLFTLK